MGPSVTSTSGGSAANAIPDVLTYFLESFGSPDVWRETSGKLTRNWETEEFKAALAFYAQPVGRGVMHPESPAMQINQPVQNCYAGKTALWSNGFTIGDVVWNRAHAAEPDFGFRGVAPFIHDGSANPVHRRQVEPGHMRCTPWRARCAPARGHRRLGGERDREP